MVRVLLSLISLVSIRTEAITCNHQSPQERSFSDGSNLAEFLNEELPIAIMKKMQCYFKLKWHKKYQIVGSHSDLEVIVAGEGDEEVEKETFAVFIDLRSVMIQT